MMKEFNIGIDLGNGWTKYGVDRLFQSKVMKGELTKIGGITNKKNVHEVTFDGETWIVGQGSSFIGKERYETKSYKITLLTAIALASGKRRNPIEANLVIGVPVEHFNELAEEVVNIIEGYGTSSIVVDGKLYIIDIKNVSVFVEGALPIKDNDDSHTVTIDIGTGTINIIEWKNQEIVDKVTNNGSFNKMYIEIAQFLNSKYRTTLNPENVQELMGQTEMETRTGTVDISDIYEIAEAYTENILSYVRQKINFDGCKYIKIFGGGAKIEQILNIWKAKFPKATTVDNVQFTNQQVYQAVSDTINEA